MPIAKYKVFIEGKEPEIIQATNIKALIKEVALSNSGLNIWVIHSNFTGFPNVYTCERTGKNRISYKGKKFGTVYLD